MGGTYMNIIVKNIETKQEIMISFPCKEKNLQQHCNALGVENTSATMVSVQQVYYSETANELLENKEFRLDELNYFTKRLESFDKNELATFYATASALKYVDMKDLINLTFNTHGYDLIADFSNLNTLGKRLYIGVESPTVEELEDFDGKSYIEDVMKNHPNPMITPYGIVYVISNELYMVYRGKQFPAYWYEQNPITVCLAVADKNEYLYLPVEQSEITKALERLEVEELEECTIEIETHELHDNVAELVLQDRSLENLNEFAQNFREIGRRGEEYIHEILEYTKAESIPELKLTMECMNGFELFKDIHSAEAYGILMICQSGKFMYDTNLEDYIDFKKYGEEIMEQDVGAFTDKGYIRYNGYNMGMGNILHEKLGMKFKDLEPIQELKLYMPLKVITYDQENEWGMMESTDEPEHIDSEELIGWEDFLTEKIQGMSYTQGEEKRGFMSYYDTHDAINAKVEKYVFEFEDVGNTVMGVAVLTLNAALTESELMVIKGEITGQASDGIGESFEQREITIDSKEVYISLWGAEDWSLKTAEELELSEQNYGMGGMSL